MCLRLTPSHYVSADYAVAVHERCGDAVEEFANERGVAVVALAKAGVEMPEHVDDELVGKLLHAGEYVRAILGVLELLGMSWVFTCGFWRKKLFRE